MDINELDDKISENFYFIRNKLKELELRLMQIEIRIFKPEEIRFDPDFVSENFHSFTSEDLDKINEAQAK